MKTPLVQDYLEQFPDSEMKYQNAWISFWYRLRTQRMGQAFMNSLPRLQYETLSESTVDPYYSSNQKAVDIAIEYLMDRGL